MHFSAASPLHWDIMIPTGRNFEVQGMGGDEDHTNQVILEGLQAGESVG